MAEYEYVLDKDLSLWYLWGKDKKYVLGIGEDPAELVDRVINKGERLEKEGDRDV